MKGHMTFINLLKQICQQASVFEQGYGGRGGRFVKMKDHIIFINPNFF